MTEEPGNYKLQARVGMTKTPEDIVSEIRGTSCKSDACFVNLQKFNFERNIAGLIRAYGDQRASQALSERQTTSPKEPTKVERVAQAIYERRIAGFTPRGGQVVAWSNLPEDQRSSEIGGAQAAIQALKEKIPWSNGLEGHLKARAITEFNAMLDTILIEKQGE